MTQQCSIEVSFQVEKEEVNERRIDKPKYWRHIFRTQSSSYNAEGALVQLQKDFPSPEYRIIVYTTTSFTVKTIAEVPQLLMYSEEDN